MYNKALVIKKIATEKLRREYIGGMGILINMMCIKDVEA